MSIVEIASIGALTISGEGASGEEVFDSSLIVREARPDIRLVGPDQLFSGIGQPMRVGDMRTEIGDGPDGRIRGLPAVEPGQDLVDEYPDVGDIGKLLFYEIGQTPLLTGDQEIALAKTMEAGKQAQAELAVGDLTSERQKELEDLVQNGLAAREHFIKANMALVIHFAAKRIGWGVPFKDLIQEGSIGLIRAVDKFDYHLGNKFSTYASWKIRQAIDRAIANQGQSIRVPVYAQGTKHKLDVLAEEMERQPDDQEVMAELLKRGRGGQYNKVESIQKILQLVRQAETVSLDAQPDRTGDDGDARYDFVADDNLPLDEGFDKTALEQLFAEIFKGLNLTERERRIIEILYFESNSHNDAIQKAAGEFEVSRERIRQIETGILSRLRHQRILRQLKDFLK